MGNNPLPKASRLVEIFPSLSQTGPVVFQVAFHLGDYLLRGLQGDPIQIASQFLRQRRHVRMSAFGDLLRQTSQAAQPGGWPRGLHLPDALAPTEPARVRASRPRRRSRMGYAVWCGYNAMWQGLLWKRKSGPGVPLAAGPRGRRRRALPWGHTIPGGVENCLTLGLVCSTVHVCP